MKDLILSITPGFVLDAYHLAWAHGSAWWYGNPSHKLVVIGVTGTKGKSTTAELIYQILTGTGHKAALSSTVHFVIGKEEERNLFKMSMPGRGYLQQFLRKAADAGCTHAVMELTSEGALQHRHAGVELNALVFTNLAPEHIERHGSYEAYGNAKLSLAYALACSPKRPRIIVANADDEWGQKFLDIDADVKAPFALADAAPYTADDRGVRFLWQGTLFSVPLPGLFNLKNCLAALTVGGALGLSPDKMRQVLERAAPVAGRAQRIERGQPFAVVVDYAHTPDSLEALYEAYKNKRIIAVIGSTGGGRDTWNRPIKGEVTDKHASTAYITNEDPYDEDPQAILAEIAKGFTKNQPRLVLDRRTAIAEALQEAKDQGDAVLITGKGTDPYIMGPKGTKEVWSDAQVAAEELAKLGYN
jgi:UDP-N-acetylmuramoyl-L-alanyl-D-glutamate--2,6-diaminopimelate ligase